MNVMIISSASTNIDSCYIKLARDVSKYLAENEFDLVYGGASFSMMGACYEEFLKHGRNIYAFTTEKYSSDLENLKGAKCFIKKTTFEMKQSMFEVSDLIVVLPGGYGTLSELISYIEENRSNNKDIPIEIYDIENYYQKLFDMLDFIKEKGFASSSFNDYVGISHNENEFKDSIDKYLIKKRRK